MYDIFISHSSADKDWVRELARKIDAEKFQGRSLRTWFDEQQLEAGDRLRPEIEAAIKNSRYLGLVLTKESVKSRWVNFEWIEFHASDREGNRIVPLLLNECEIPIHIRDRIYIDFRDKNNFDACFSTLMKKLCTSETQTLEAIRERISQLMSGAAEVYEGGMATEPTPEGDALYEYVSGLDIKDIRTEGLAIGAFDVMLDYLEKLSDPAAYNLAMLVAECLAALLSQSIKYNCVVQNWHTRDHWTGKMVAIRAYSKLAEILPDVVDTSGLLHCAAGLDCKARLSRQEESLQLGMTRATGKMNDTAKGQDLIEDLSIRGPVSKQIAAGAISIDPSESGPIYLLSFFEGLAKRTIQKKSPSTRLLNTLAILLKDPDPTVRQEAAETANSLKRSWPDLKYEAAAQPALPPQTLDLEAGHGRYLPFSGRIYKATKKNMLELSKSIQTGTIICLAEPGVIDAYFYGASGLIIPEQPSLSHQCMCLMNAGVPYVMLSEANMDKVPDGLHGVVDEGRLHVTVKSEI